MNQFKEYLEVFRPTIQGNLLEIKAQRDKYLQEEPKEFHEEIQQQYLDSIKDDIMLELTNNFPNVSPEDLVSFVEEFDVKEWLK